MVDAETIVAENKNDLVTIKKEATIHEALLTMIDNNVGSILVEDQGQIVGIWTERDLLRDTTKEDFDPATSKVGDFMVSPVISAPHSDSVYNLMDKFLGLRISHLLIEKEGRTVGFLSAGDVMRATLADKSDELSKINAMVGWEYYENWRFRP